VQNVSMSGRAMHRGAIINYSTVITFLKERTETCDARYVERISLYRWEFLEPQREGAVTTETEAEIGVQYKWFKKYLKDDWI